MENATKEHRLPKGISKRADGRYQGRADNAGEYPVIFFVDELDRCNPRYAVAVLERIKHLFEIPNIIFVLAINKKELSNAIQGYYGSSKIDSNT